MKIDGSKELIEEFKKECVNFAKAAEGYMLNYLETKLSSQKNGGSVMKISTNIFPKKSKESKYVWNS